MRQFKSPVVYGTPHASTGEWHFKADTGAARGAEKIELPRPNVASDMPMNRFYIGWRNQSGNKARAPLSAASADGSRGQSCNRRSKFCHPAFSAHDVAGAFLVKPAGNLLATAGGGAKKRRENRCLRWYASCLSQA
jgi:hypothetical protein